MPYFFAAIGAVDFLGNPAGMLNALSTGFEEFLSDVADLNLHGGGVVWAVT